MAVKRIILGCLLGVLAVAVWGCAPTIVGTDAGVYSNMKLYAVHSQSMDAVYEATLKALDDLEIEVTDKAKDIFAAKVIAKAADEKLITIRIAPTDTELVKLTIKVGSFGDEERARIIYGRISQKLGISK